MKIFLNKTSLNIKKYTHLRSVTITLSFARGFISGFIIPYFLFDSKTGNFELVQLPSALIIGILNMVRNLVISKEQIKKDNYNFLKWGVFAGILTCGISSMPLVIFSSGVFFGTISVLYHRYSDKNIKN